MTKGIKTPDIISAIKHRGLFGSLPAFQSLDSWAGWLVWLKTVFALPMDESELDLSPMYGQGIRHPLHPQRSIPS